MLIKDLKQFINDLNKNVRGDKKSYIVFDNSITDDMIIDDDFSDEGCNDAGAQFSVAAIVPKNESHLEKIENFLNEHFLNDYDEAQDFNLYSNEMIGVYQKYLSKDEFDITNNYIFSDFKTSTPKEKKMTHEEIQSFLMDFAREANSGCTAELNIFVVKDVLNNRFEIYTSKYYAERVEALVDSNPSFANISVSEEEYPIHRYWVEGFDLDSSSCTIGNGWVTSVKDIESWFDGKTTKAAKAAKEISSKIDILDDLNNFARVTNERSNRVMVSISHHDSSYPNHLVVNYNAPSTTIKNELEMYFGDEYDNMKEFIFINTNNNNTDIIKLWGNNNSEYSIGKGYVPNDEFRKQIKEFNFSEEEQEKILIDIAAEENKNSKNIIIEKINRGSSPKSYNIVKINPSYNMVGVRNKIIERIAVIKDCSNIRYSESLNLETGHLVESNLYLLGGSRKWLSKQEFINMNKDIFKDTEETKMTDPKATQKKFMDAFKEHFAYLNAEALVDSDNEIKVAMFKSQSAKIGFTGSYIIYCEDAASFMESLRLEGLGTYDKPPVVNIDQDSFDADDSEFVVKQSGKKYYFKVYDLETLGYDKMSGFISDSLSDATYLYIGEDKPIKAEKFTERFGKEMDSEELIGVIKESHGISDDESESECISEQSCSVEHGDEIYIANTSCRGDEYIEEKLSKYSVECEDEYSAMYKVPTDDGEKTIYILDGIICAGDIVHEMKNDIEDNCFITTKSFKDSLEYANVYTKDNETSMDGIISIIEKEKISSLHGADLFNYIVQCVKEQNIEEGLDKFNFHEVQFKNKEFNYALRSEIKDNVVHIKTNIEWFNFDHTDFLVNKGVSNNKDGTHTTTLQDINTKVIYKIHRTDKNYYEWLKTRGNEKQDKYTKVSDGSVYSGYLINDLDEVIKKREAKQKDFMAKINAIEEVAKAVKDSQPIKPAKETKSFDLASMVQVLKKDAEAAAYKTAATKVTDMIRNFFISMVEKKSGSDAARAIARFFDTEYGAGVLSLMVGNLITSSGFFDEVKQSERIAKEFRVNGLERFASNIVDDILPDISKVIATLPKEENYRVKTNQLESKPETIDDESLIEDMNALNETG
jgi:hypothetical protein